MRGLSRPAPLVVALLAVVVVAGCGSAAPPSASVATPASAPTRSLSPTAEPPGPSGWLSVATDGVAFLTWTRTDDALTGSLTWVHTTPADPHSPVNVTADISGTINGRSVTLSLYPAPTTSGTWTGLLDSERLTLSYPADDGSIATLALVPGAVDDYNAALGAFRAAEQAAWLSDQKAAASAAADALTLECSVRVVDHDATIVVYGENARDECARLVERVPLDPPDAWGEVRQPVEVVDAGRVVCTATIDSFYVEVQDTGGADYGSYACRILAPPPYLGVGLEETSWGLRLASWTDSSGRSWPAVWPGGPADNADLRAGDIISAIDGTAVRSLQGINDIIARRAIGDVLTLTVLRNASELMVSLTLEARPSDY